MVGAAVARAEELEASLVEPAAQVWRRLLDELLEDEFSHLLRKLAEVDERRKIHGARFAFL